MSRNNLLYAGIMLGATLLPVAIVHADDIIITTPPPAVQEETVPPARTGYIWAPGYQRWDGDHYTWVTGHWVEARVHSHWEPDSWEKVDDTHWRFRAGHWQED